MADVKLDEMLSSDEATVQAWFLEEGDPINEGDDIVELSTGESTIIVQAPVSGILTEVYFDEGENVEKGEVLCKIDEEDIDLEDSED